MQNQLPTTHRFTSHIVALFYNLLHFRLYHFLTGAKGLNAGQRLDLGGGKWYEKDVWWDRVTSQ